MRIEERIEVAVPLRTAYDQWSQLGSLPKFCKRVRLVAVERPSLSRWMVQIGPTRHAFLAEVVEQQPDSHIRWRTLGRRLRHHGEVRFDSLDPQHTRVTVSMQLDLPSPLTVVSDRLVRRWVRDALAEFATYIEGMGDAGQGWRGAIRGGRVEDVAEEPPGFPAWPHG